MNLFQRRYYHSHPKENKFTNTTVLIFMSISFSIYLLLLILLLYSFSNFAYSTTIDNSNTEERYIQLNSKQVITLLNLERIKTQIFLANSSLNNQDIKGSFMHAYIPHSVIFPVLKDKLYRIDPVKTKELENRITDLPMTIKSILSNKQSINTIHTELKIISSLIENISASVVSTSSSINPGFNKNSSTFSSPMPDKYAIYPVTSIQLLNDAINSYVLAEQNKSTSNNNKETIASRINYENAQGLIDSAQSLLLKNLSLNNSINKDKVAEINILYGKLKNSVYSKQSPDMVAKIIKSIVNYYYSEIATNKNSSTENSLAFSKYFSNIYYLLSKTIDELNVNNPKQADKYTIQAYLDNYEYLEAPIEKINSTLKDILETGLRDTIRNMIKTSASAQEVESFVNQSIIPKLRYAQVIVKNNSSFNQLPSPLISLSSSIDEDNINNNNSAIGESANSLSNIDVLKQGFGIYTGEIKEMGQVEDSEKQIVRSDIDSIRSGLNQMLQQYKAKDYEQSINTARSVYLDSYESIEVPLRPINPDFTLDMEIKFAELRNLMQQQKPFESIEKKVFEIRQGLDESERLVSGTGVIAPTIAFSSSFSIIFREGLESALIIGAMLTYLEASRNEKFKKHIYFGILFAIVATSAVWVVASHIIEISGVNRELIEAIAGISAVAVLFWVSFWILNKVETKKWIEFVKAKVWQATATGSVMIFVMLSFFTVFREGFETVLFYQSMFSFAKYMESYVLLGLLLGIASITAVAIIIKKLGKRLPLRILFGLTMGIGAYMSIAFIGNAIRSFQDSGYLPTTSLIGTIPRLDINMASMTGIHPTLESIIAQLVLLGIYAVGSTYVLIIQPRKKQQIAMARKSMADRKSSS